MSQHELVSRLFDVVEQCVYNANNKEEYGSSGRWTRTGRWAVLKLSKALKDLKEQGSLDLSNDLWVGLCKLIPLTIRKKLVRKFPEVPLHGAYKRSERRQLKA